MGRSEISHFDIYEDKDGMLWLKNKRTGKFMETFTHIDDFFTEVKNAKKTNLMVELYLTFGNDFDVYSLSHIIEIPCNDCKNRNETKINPITLKPNDSYWLINTGYIETYDGEIAIKLLLDKIKNKISMIKNILEENCGEAIIYFVPVIENGITPSIILRKEILELALLLNATIEFDMYVN